MKTYEQQTLQFGEDGLTCFPEDSPVNRSARQGKEKVRRTTATYGRKCFEQFARFPRVGSWAKTFSELLIGTGEWYSSRCALTWKLKGTKFNRMYFQLAASALPTKGSGHGLLHTPRATEIVEDPAKFVKRMGDRSENCFPNLSTQIIYEGMLLTPTSTCISERSQNAMEKRKKYRQSIGRNTVPPGNLSEQINLMMKGATLTDMLPTPTASCSKAGTTVERTDGISRRHSLNHLMAQEAGKTSQLNPLFVAEMMGFPVNWTVLPFLPGAEKALKPTEMR